MPDTSDGTWTIEPAPLDADTAQVVKAADDIELALNTPAVALGVAIMHSIDPAVYAELMARIDGDKA
jgi:hypothetical protein